jgi:glycosyltransferase involved in cell wall biosynthesis
LTFNDDNAFLCVYVGRISGEKRLDIIIDALQMLRPGGKQTYLAIIGDGPAAAKYSKLHGKDNRIFCKPRFLEHDELAEVHTPSYPCFFASCNFVTRILVNRFMRRVICMSRHLNSRL